MVFQKRLLLFTGLLFFCSTLFAQQKIKTKDLKQLKKRMEGHFSSKAQSQADTSYFDIHLNMKQIWKDRKDGYWLYVEQAMSTALQKPYRQRIYHLYKQDDTTLVSKVFEIKSPGKYINAQNNIDVLKVLTVDSLIDRQGCAIYLKKNNKGNYYGSTPSKECLSTLRGATYATSEVIIEKNKLLSWDRGWSAADKQVWGAVKGGYEFIKE
jgi:CpeT protein